MVAAISRTCMGLGWRVMTRLSSRGIKTQAYILTEGFGYFRCESETRMYGTRRVSCFHKICGRIILSFCILKQTRSMKILKSKLFLVPIIKQNKHIIHIKNFWCNIFSRYFDISNQQINPNIYSHS